MPTNHDETLASRTTDEPLSHLLEELADLRVRNDRLSKRVEALEKPRPLARGGQGDRTDVEPSASEATVTRRGMLRRLGAVGAAGAGAALGSSVLSAQPAAAAAGDPVLAGTFNDAGDDSTTLISSSPLEVLSVANTAAGSALVGGCSQPTNPKPAVHGGTRGTGAGVEGFATEQGVGLKGSGGRAQLLLRPNPHTAGPPTTGNHVQGEVFVDSLAAHYRCVVAGTPGTWRKDVVLGDSNNSGRATTYLDSAATVEGATLIVGNSAVAANHSASAVFGSVSHSGNASPGVMGMTAGSGAGVRGRALNASGVGMQADGGRAQLLLVPADTAGPPRAGNHVVGEVFVDSAGEHYICAGAGTPGLWRKVATGAPGFSAHSGSINFLASPVRIWDSRGGAPLAARTSVDLQIAGVKDRVSGIGVPMGAVGVMGNVTVTQTVAPGGFLALYPQGSPAPATSNINWFGANQNLSTAAIVGLSASGKITILNGPKPTHVIFDVAAFVF